MSLEKYIGTTDGLSLQTSLVTTDRMRIADPSPTGEDESTGWCLDQRVSTGGPGIGISEWQVDPI